MLSVIALSISFPDFQLEDNSGRLTVAVIWVVVVLTAYEDLQVGSILLHCSYTSKDKSIPNCEKVGLLIFNISHTKA